MVKLTKPGEDTRPLPEKTREDVLEELELLRDVLAAEQEMAAGEGVPHDRARGEVHHRLRH